MKTHMGWGRVSLRRWMSKAGAVSAVAAITAGAAAPGAIADQAFEPGDRTLQSVDVAMAPDGTLTDIESTVVTTTGDADDTTTSSYSPQDVAQDLPVRVLTAYRTDDGTGTDLDELSGYTGKVRIDLTVQNLTVRPRTVSYDAGGSSRSQAALVGVPLTVVGAASLDGTDPSSVVTDAASGDDVTNGVLSQSGDGTTQVQWATILAPPRLSSTATLTLVADVEDFQVPSFDLSVQPGLVTDPSVGALVDAAFNPKASAELELESRTIDLITDVTGVLDRASQTISHVRSTLDSSSRTLGTKTVADLQASASGVASSMKALDGSVTALGTDLSASLRSTRSTVLAQLQQAVRSVDQMLGDTSARAPRAHLRGTGCDTIVAAPGRADSVYGTLLQVVSQLDGYAKATGACKAQLQRSILASVGPAHPDDDSCAGSTSVTCALHGVEGSFQDITDQLRLQGNKKIQGLQPETLTDALARFDQLSGLVDTLMGNRDTLGATGPLAGVRISQLQSNVHQLRADLSDVVDDVDDVHQDAVNGRAGVDHIAAQNDLLAQHLCDLVGQGTITAETANELRAYLVSTSCPDANGASSPLTPVGEPMAGQVATQAAAWDRVVAGTDTTDGSQGVGAAVAAMRRQIDALDSEIEALQAAMDAKNGDIEDAYDALSGTVDHLADARTELGRKLSTAEQQQTRLLAGVTDVLDLAATTMNDELSKNIDPQIRQVSRRAASDSQAVGAMFEKSASGLSAAAARITRNGASMIKSQKTQFGRQEVAAGREISRDLENGLSSIATGVASATRDTEAASTLLANDLNSVLLDLGDRRVNGSGLLGAMTTSAATARTADYQLALATDKATSYANVRSADVAGIFLRQAETEAALQMQADMPAFRLDLPEGATHRTVYSFHLEGGR